MTAASPPAQPAPALLETRSLTKRFEGVIALSKLDLSVRQGSIAGLIGPNGAGKTTLFNVATGFYPPDEGTITLAGKRLQGLRPHSITALGIARTFQNIRLFANMTALENVLVGQHMHADFVARATPEEEDSEPARRFRISLGSADHWAYRAAFPGRMLWEVLATLGRPGVVQETERVAVDRSQDLLGFVGLKGRHNEIARSLPYGDQRRLELARALATRPKLLLLDEPTAGMNPQESQEIVHLIRSVRDELGTTVLLIEHHMRVVMGVCEMITVLDYGEKIAEGPPETVQRDKRVIEAYLGTGHSGTGNGAAGG